MKNSTTKHSDFSFSKRTYRWLPLFVVFVLLFSSFAKSQTTISATLKDSKTKQAIEFAGVELLTVKDSLITGCITDTKGYFEIAAPPLAEKIRIKYIGYKMYVAPIKDINQSTIWLEEDAQELDEITVKGSNRTNKIDRDVYTVTKDLKVGTVSSQELLGRLNGVIFNQYDKSISVNGSTKVLILVDGVEKDQEMTKNLPTDRIERVEVIKDPVGKYATDGYTAVINIVLKKDFAGIDMLISNTTFLDLVGTNGNDVYTQDYGNMNITYTYKKLNVYTSGRFYDGNFNIPVEMTKKYGVIKTASEAMDYKKPNVNSSPLNYRILLGADYALSKKHSISAEFRYSNNQDNSLSDFGLTNYILDSVVSTGIAYNKTNSNSDEWQGTLTYKAKFNANNTLDADLRYNYSDGSSNNILQQDKFSNVTDIINKGKFARFNANFNHQFNSKLNLDLGYGNVFNESTSELYSSRFTSNEYRNRASLYLSYRPTAKLNTKIGCIVENYEQKNETKNVNLTAFMPYANIQFIPTQKFNIVAKYHAGIEYPSIDQLSPFKSAQDSLFWTLGNPSLKTNKYHSFSIDFNIMNVITFTTYYSFNDAKIANFVSPDPEYPKRYLSQNINADEFQKYGASLSFTVPFAKTLFWQNRLDWNQSHIAYLNESNTENNFTVSSNLIWVVPKYDMVNGLILQQMQSRSVAIQGYSTDQNNILLAMIQKSFLKKKLNLAFFYMIPVKLEYDQPSLVETSGYYQETNTSLNLIKNLFFFEIKFHFNAGKQVSQKQTDEDDNGNSKKKGGLGL